MNTEEICCPEFNPIPWDNVLVSWHEKYFLTEKSRTIFYMPLNFGGTMKKLFAKANTVGATNFDAMYLSEHTSKWNMKMLLSLDKEVPGAESEKLTGQFYCKVYEGNFKDSGKWEKDFSLLAKSNNYTFKRRFSWYTTCPDCAKKYGKNYVVLMGQIS